MDHAVLKETKSRLTKNRFFFGIGTVGRDMLYTIVSMFLIVYYTEVVGVSNTTLAWITGLMVTFRIFDALNDPIMGMFVDNTKTKWGKFKPWILFGAIGSGILTVLLFTDFSLDGAAFIALFGVIYLLWGMAFTTNDISYWSMVPALSKDQKEREKISSFARIFANIGLFAVVVGIVPITDAFADFFGGNLKAAYTLFAAIICIILWAGTAATLFGVKETSKDAEAAERTSLKGMVKAIFKNDQLLVIAASMALFTTGYMITTSFGVHFFKYAYKNEDMYSIFALILGIAQLSALFIFPFLTKKFTRRQLFIAAIIIVVIGYIGFFFSPMNMIPIAIFGLLLFLGQAFVQILTLVYLADTVEYGEWKLNKRNESVSFSIQPFINKFGGAIGSGVLGVTLIISGINGATPETVTESGILIMKFAMMIIPLIFIIGGFLINFFKYKIDKKFYDKIISDLNERNNKASNNDDNATEENFSQN